VRASRLLLILLLPFSLWAAGAAVRSMARAPLRPGWAAPHARAARPPAPPAAEGDQAPAAQPGVGPAAAPASGQTADRAPDGDGAEAPLAAVARALLPVRVPRPVVPPGPRRIGLQAGHWRTGELPEELRRLENQTGTSGGGVAEWQLNLDIANRAAAVLRSRGYVVDVLPTVIPPGYLADAFVALHADGDTSGTARGFKAAHGSRRGPYEDELVRALVEEYGKATGLPQDSAITRNMLGYYAFSWTRFQSTAAPHTPAAILEMGFLTSPTDRATLLNRSDLVVAGVVNGITRFLDEVPAGAAFADDLIVPPAPPRLPPAGTPTPR
jgi:N-acetylmuramoyl-L-alanine amidase